MRELSVYYCPVCGRYSYNQPADIPACPLCEVSMLLLMPYSDFRHLDQEERDMQLLQKMIAGDTSLPSHLLAFLRSRSSKVAATLVDSQLHQLESENKKLNDTIQWMHQTIWELLCQNRNLEHQLEKQPENHQTGQDPKNMPSA